jgi:hypothetical protein
MSVTAGLVHAENKGIMESLNISLGAFSALITGILALYIPIGKFLKNKKADLVVHPANSLRLSCSRAVEGSCLSAWEQGHDASVAGPDG